ncbi:hypothetical protein J2Z40_002107 [Cytobacillus eiseniae]|uniref:Uncharacterized protein n=1 Tax=Cytobacillus eiseniae TaxID=762947 RepID=A0ABS4RGT8_9BACI|nr:hypothetical protein [Cytobacillus eiseniae]MBP2241544.1 hypothetical protein [Cytobacillus eiseniae]
MHKNDLGYQSAYYVSLGTNLDQTRLNVGIHSSTNVTAFNQETVFKVILEVNPNYVISLY